MGRRPGTFAVEAFRKERPLDRRRGFYGSRHPEAACACASRMRKSGVVLFSDGNEQRDYLRFPARNGGRPSRSPRRGGDRSLSRTARASVSSTGRGIARMQASVIEKPWRKGLTGTRSWRHDSRCAIDMKPTLRVAAGTCAAKSCATANWRRWSFEACSVRDRRLLLAQVPRRSQHAQAPRTLAARRSSEPCRAHG